MLIGNTGGDRLIDWVGEFNSYIVPFAPFGIATVSRQVPPWLYEFLYAAVGQPGRRPDPRRRTRTRPIPSSRPATASRTASSASSPRRTTGCGRTRPAARPIRSRATSPAAHATCKRSADFSDGTLQTFAVDSGVLGRVGRRARRSPPQSQGQDAAAVWYHDQYLPVYYELVGRMQHRRSRPPAGRATPTRSSTTSARPTSSSPASTTPSNKLVIGHRDASGWHLDTWGSIPGGVKYDTWYDLLVAVNGTRSP